MAFENSNFSHTCRAASAVNAGQPVALVGAVAAGSALDETVVPAGSLNLDVFAPVRADYLHLVDYQDKQTTGGGSDA